MSRRAPGVASVRVEGATAIVRYVPGEVESPAVLRRAAVSTLRRTMRGKVRVGRGMPATGSLANGMHAMVYTAA